MEDVVISSAVRTPMGSFQGDLDSFSASELGGIAIEGAMKKAGFTRVDEVIMGNVLELAKVKHLRGRRVLQLV